MRVTGAQILSDNLRQLALIRAHEAGEELCLCVKCYPWARRWSLTMWARMNTSSPTQQSNHRYDPERNSFHFSEGEGGHLHDAASESPDAYAPWTMTGWSPSTDRGCRRSRRSASCLRRTITATFFSLYPATSSFFGCMRPSLFLPV